MARHVIATEGVLGLYRGFGMSIATFVPSSGIWWGSYGAFQKLVWHQVQPPVFVPWSIVPHVSGMGCRLLLENSCSSHARGCTEGPPTVRCLVSQSKNCLQKT